MAFLLALLVTLGSWTTSTADCDCREPCPPDEAAVQAEAVLVGIVTGFGARRPWWDSVLEALGTDYLLSRIGIERERPDILYYEARFRVVYSWKEPQVDSTTFGFKLRRFFRRVFGVDDHVLTVRWPVWDYYAQVDTPEGRYYLVYGDRTPVPTTGDSPSDASRSGDPFWAFSCQGTAPLEEARYDLLVLGHPVNDYRLPSDTLELVDPTSLSEEDKREILRRGIWRAAGFGHFSGEVREKDPNGNFPVWFTWSPCYQLAYGGQINGRLVDDGDWREVNEALKELEPQLWEVYRTYDWQEVEDTCPVWY